MRNYRWTVPVVFLLLLLSSGPAAQADFELLLEDGQLLSGVDVRHKDGLYLLELATGHVISIPEELVADVRITAGSAPGVRKTDPELLAGTRIDLDDGEGPASGLRIGEPELLAGEDRRLPTTSEQIEVFGPPARFAESTIDPDWRPQSDWDESTDVTEFDPARWFESIIDPEWEPRSDYTGKSDVTEFNPSRWSESTIDPLWAPEDGFKPVQKSERPIPRRSTSRVPSAIPRVSSTTPADEIRSCARQIFEPLIATRSISPVAKREALGRLRVALIASRAFARLPIPLYEGTWVDEGATRRAVFTYSRATAA